MKCCGVAVARPRGHSRAPTPTIEQRANMGTVPAPPACRASSSGGGLGPARPIGPGRGGAAVVLRAGESPAHGEGRQWFREGKEAAMPKDAPLNGGAPEGPLRPHQRVSGIQTKLHRWAAADHGRRFDDLFNLVSARAPHRDSTPAPLTSRIRMTGLIEIPFPWWVGVSRRRSRRRRRCSRRGSRRRPRVAAGRISSATSGLHTICSRCCGSRGRRRPGQVRRVRHCQSSCFSQSSKSEASTWCWYSSEALRFASRSALFFGFGNGLSRSTVVVTIGLH